MASILPFFFCEVRPLLCSPSCLKAKVVPIWRCLIYSRVNIAPDKDWRQLGIYPFWLNWVFQILNWVFKVFVLGIHLKANKQWNRTLFLLIFCLLSVSLSESTLAILVYLRCYFPLSSKIQRIYQVIFDSSNHQHGIRVSYDMISFNFSGAFSPTLPYCKARRMP